MSAGDPPFFRWLDQLLDGHPVQLCLGPSRQFMAKLVHAHDSSARRMDHDDYRRSVKQQFAEGPFAGQFIDLELQRLGMLGDLVLQVFQLVGEIRGRIGQHVNFVGSLAAADVCPAMLSRTS